MAIIDGITGFLVNYTGLETNAPLWVNYLGPIGTEYSVVPLPGERILETYIDDTTIREFSFAFQSIESTVDQSKRIDSVGFYEEFAAWLEQQTLDGNLPTLDSGKTALSISASNWGFLFEQGESDSAIYQVTCRLVYQQDPGTPTPPGD